MIASLKLKNVILKDGLPRPDYIKILKLAEVGLISLNEDFTIPNFPSKINTYFSLKKPVLASLDLTEVNCGYWAEAGNTEDLTNKLYKLYNDKALRQELGENGYNHMVNNLLPEHAYNIICKNV